MESDERPAKIRKLSSHHERDTLPAQTTASVDNPTDTLIQDAAGTTPTQPPTTAPLADAPENCANKPNGTPKKKTAKSGARKKNQAKKERKREEKRTNPDAWKEKQKQWVKPTMLPITLLIDCDFDNLMRDNERISLGGQLTRCYSDNKNAPFRAHLAVCSFNGKLRERFDGILNKSYQNWKGVRFLDEDFVVASEKAKEWMADDKRGGRLAGVFEKYAPANPVIAEEQQETANTQVIPNTDAPTEANTEETKTEENKSQETKLEAPKSKPQHPIYIKPTSLPPADLEALHAQAETIYLSADSDYTLTELKPFSTYIIGGLVDKNREKGICAARAAAAGVKTARLPIGDYLAMASRKVLTTNHVHEIMLKWLECGDWGEAFMKVIPKRKGGQLKGYAGEGGEEVDEEDDADEENDHVEEIEERDEDEAEEENEADAVAEQTVEAEKTE
ncbi:hypothetical protein E4T50_04416 [Aureobasidium sp. EXF-12298]|nr:hypothetical protein E4T50_04416 [Aureobasidium sp. EXF-12298]